MQKKFLQTKIAFSEQNPISICFAHLQNILLSAYQQKKSSVLDLDKICHVLNDIYLEHRKLQYNFEELTKSTKSIMMEFSQMMNTWKDDREKLRDVTEDRLDLLGKVRAANDDALEISVENQMLKETVDKLKQINELLMEKGKVVEEQLQNRKIADIGYQSYNRICNEYDRLLQSNTQIRKQLMKICNQSEAIEKVSRPMQLINRALKSDPKIRQEIWEIGYKEENLPVAYLKEFQNFSFDQFFKDIRESANL